MAFVFIDVHFKSLTSELMVVTIVLQTTEITVAASILIVTAVTILLLSMCTVWVYRTPFVDVNFAILAVNLRKA